MSEHEELSKKLLVANGLSEGALRESDREGLRTVFETERRRSAHVRNVMLLSWLVFIVLFVGTLAVYLGVAQLPVETDVGRGTANVIAILAIAGIPLSGIAFIIAVVATIAWGLRMATGPRGVDERLARIEEQLARLGAERERPAGEPPVAGI